jgi:transcriptional regulator with XRE-family HTH domain
MRLSPATTSRYHFGMHGGDFVLMARRRAGLSQRELAERLGCRQATIARWECDERHPSFEETQAAVRACGFDLAGSIVADDRSWWPQIALQLEQSPSERVTSLTSPGAINPSPALDALARHGVPVIVVGEVAGALQGWPLVLSGAGVVEVCGGVDTVGPALIEAGFSEANGSYVLPTGQSISLAVQPPGTHGLGDLARGADAVPVGTGAVTVAGVVDLLRSAEASAAGGRSREVLAYQALLDVRRAQRSRSASTATDDQRLQHWLSQQTPVA